MENHEVEDTTPPDVEIDQETGQNDPTNSSPILFNVDFSESVTGFTGDDISFTGSTAPGTLAASVLGSGASYSVSVSGMTGSGLVVIPSLPIVLLTLQIMAIQPPPALIILLLDITNPTVTINQSSGQADPTALSPIVFDVEFSEAVTGFTASDVSFTGSTSPGRSLRSRHWFWHDLSGLSQRHDRIWYCHRIHPS